MLHLSQKKFDELLDSLETMEYRCGNWLPTIDEIKTEIEPNIENKDVLQFALWILETGITPKTPEGKEARRYLMSLVNEHIKIS